MTSQPRSPVPHNAGNMASGESNAHQNLKRLAVAWAQQHGYAAVATEVMLPRSGYRADVAAYRSGQRGSIGMTAVFECKQARADFLKDSYSAELSSKRLKELDQRREKLERLLKLHYPSLRSGETLFAEFDSVDLRGMEHKTYRRVLREMRTLQGRLYAKTKFEKLLRYRCANLNHLVVEQGIVAAHEVPVGWGLLVHRDGDLIVEQKPVWQEISERDRLVLLERIANAGTRARWPQQDRSR
jgi:hypothetical protein